MKKDFFGKPLLNNYEFDNTLARGERLFEVGKQFPPKAEIGRLAKNKRVKKLFDGKHKEVFHRASTIYRSKVKQEQLNTLYIACNILGILTTKPSDLLFGEAPIYESGREYDSLEQEAVNRIVSRNRLNLLGHEITTGAGYRGDSFIKVYFNYREDLSELPYIPSSHKMEPIIEAQDASTVFPELAKGSRKKFKAVNIAHVEWTTNAAGTEIPYLNVERHLPGFIEYSRFRLQTKGDGFTQGITTFDIVEEIPLENNLIETGVPNILVYHIPYQTTDEEWQGIGTVERIEGLIAAINDRLVQIDHILFKHSDPNMYGPDLSDAKEISTGGIYIPVRKDEVPPAYMTWSSEMDAAFKELELLLSLVYQVAETPQWLFGTVIGTGTGGTGTSHTDSGSIKARFMPILSKVKRIRSHVDAAYKQAIHDAMILENIGNESIPDFKAYEPVEISILWNEGLPRDEKEVAEMWQIRTGGKATADVRTAIKDMSQLNDTQAEALIKRIQEEEDAEMTVTSSIFNDETNHITDEDVDGE